MNDIDISSNPLLRSLQANNTQTQQAGDDLGQDAFLKLMIAQLRHQDPLSPAENGEFIAQLAQFSSVEGITNLNTAVGDLVNEFRSSRALEASALVGRQVEVNSNIGRLAEGANLIGTIELPASTSRLQVVVESPAGELLRVEELGEQFAGNIQFGWNGENTDGEVQPAGLYRVSAVALIDGEETAVPVSLAANVNSVSIGADNSMTLDVDGVGQVSIDSVRRFL